MIKLKWKNFFKVITMNKPITKPDSRRICFVSQIVETFGKNMEKIVKAIDAVNENAIAI